MRRLGRFSWSALLLIASLALVPGLASSQCNPGGDGGTSSPATIAVGTNVQTLRVPILFGGRLFEFKFRVGSSSTSSAVRRGFRLGW